MADDIETGQPVPSPYGTPEPVPEVNNRPAFDKARGALSERRAAAQQGFVDANTQRQQVEARYKTLLDEATQNLKDSHEGKGFGTVNLPLLALGAGMLQSKGNFGDALGAGVDQMGKVVAGQRMADSEFSRKMLDLQLKRGEFEQGSAKERAGMSKAELLALDKQIGRLDEADIKSLSAEEKARLAKEKADEKLAGGLSPMAKAKADLKAGRITQEEYDAIFKHATEANDPRPTEQKLYEEAKRLHEANPANAGMPFPMPDQWAADKAAARTTAVEMAKHEAKAVDAAPQIIQTSEAAIKNIDKLMDHKGLDKVVGTILGPVTVHKPGSLEKDFDATLQNLKGKVFMAAFNSLKGGGQITEKEGEKAEAAMAALDRAQSPEQFKENLADFRKTMVEIKEASEKRLTAKGNKAAVSAPPATQAAKQPVPEGGELIGTSGGKPVYKMPDGSTVIAK